MVEFLVAFELLYFSVDRSNANDISYPTKINKRDHPFTGRAIGHKKGVVLPQGLKHFPPESQMLTWNNWGL